jgi:plastocyanin
MKKIVLISILIGLLGLVIYAVVQKRNTNTSGVNSSNNRGESVIISMEDDDYQPSEITIKKGTTVEFINKSSDWRWPASNLHPTHDIYSEFDPKEPIASGKTWSFRFDKAGSWRMHDHLAPYITGTIVVEP